MRVYFFLVAIIAVLTVAVVSVQRQALADAPDRSIPTIEVSSPASGEIHVTWGTPSDADSLTSYRVSWALWETDGFTSYKVVNSDTGGNAYPEAPATSYAISGLTPGEYAVFVRARYEDFQNGPFKKSAKVTVASSTPVEPTPEPTETPTTEVASEPGAITGLTLTSSQPGHLWISWDEADPSPTEYRLNWAPVDESFPSWNSQDGGNLWLARTEQDFSNLVDAGVTYKLRMRAIYRTGPNAPWSGPWSEVVTRRVRNHPPAAPTDLRVDSATPDKVVLSWSAPDHNGLTGYRILRGSSASTLETIVDDAGTLDVSYTDTTTEDGTTYYYAVMALSADGDSPQSATATVTTPRRPVLREVTEDVGARQSDTTTVGAPVLSEATVDGATMTLTYDSDLATTSVPATSAYTVTVAGSTIAVSNVGIADRKVTLTLEAHVPAEATVTITYNVPSANPVQTDALDGTTNMRVSAAALDNHSVENRTGILIINMNRPRVYGGAVGHLTRVPTPAFTRTKLAQQFTTGNKTGGYQLGIVRLRIAVPSGNVFRYDGRRYDDPDHSHWGTDLDIPRVSIWSDSSGSPSAELHELVVARSLSQSIDVLKDADFYANDFTLQPGTKYWVVVESRSDHYWIPRGFNLPGSSMWVRGYYVPNDKLLSESFDGWKIEHSSQSYIVGSWDEDYTVYYSAGQFIHSVTVLFAVFSESPVSQPFFRNADGNGHADRVRLHYVDKVYSATDDLSLGTLPVNNFDDDTLTFAVVGGDTAAFNSRFTLDSTTGEISLKEIASRSRVADTTYQIRVTVTDGEDQFGRDESSPTVDDTADVYIIAVEDVVLVTG